MRLKQAGALLPDAGRSKIAEDYRLIKRPLLINAFGHDGNSPVAKGNLIMVTSAFPREGKSFTAINLAISMATELDKTVLLVDADVTKSSVIEYLGLKADQGLLDVLRDPGVQLADVMISQHRNETVCSGYFHALSRPHCYFRLPAIIGDQRSLGVSLLHGPSRFCCGS